MFGRIFVWYADHLYFLFANSNFAYFLKLFLKSPNEKITCEIRHEVLNIKLLLMYHTSMLKTKIINFINRGLRKAVSQIVFYVSQLL